MPQQPNGGPQLKTGQPAPPAGNAGMNPGAAVGSAMPAMGRPEPARDAWSQGLNAAVQLGEYVRTEHGREGVKRFVCALMPLIPYSMIESLARALDVPAPAAGSGERGIPERSVRMEEDKPPNKPAMSTEQMLALMQAFGGGQKSGGGLDPKLLLQLMGS